MNNKILVIEDESDIRELVEYNLVKEGYDVVGVASGEDGLKTAKESNPHLVLLDLMLPGVDGLEVCKELKRQKHTQGIPIIMMSAKGEENDIVSGLELGAEDYITKPFSPKILSARVKTVLRRNKQAPANNQSVVEAKEIHIDPVRFEITVAGDLITLSATEFKILHHLVRHPGWVFTRHQIVDAVRGEDYAVTDRAVDVQIVGIRRKLGEYGNYIETVRGVGYRFVE
jgi:two-component system phosphate regulon response regulator PhoB